MAGRAKENLPGGSLKYLFVYLKICILKCSYRIYIYIYLILSSTYLIISPHSWPECSGPRSHRFFTTYSRDTSDGIVWEVDLRRIALHYLLLGT